ncbi:MAG: UDP-N-acetylmuramate dehydrogenase [Desulfovibrio sp.]|nr:UDP-N-acetylmuramate dehydrogenase [Desulfovibrio sp.]
MREERSPSFARLTTLRLGGTARCLLSLNSEDDLPLLSEYLSGCSETPLVLGNGSNILALDGELPIVLVRLAFPREVEIVRHEGDLAHVSVSASCPLPKFLKFCAEHSFSGLEGLSGIPGTVGGAIAMNAGSFGTETCANLVSVDIWQDGVVRTLRYEDWSYAYRHFSFNGDDRFYIILRAVFALYPGVMSAIVRAMNQNFLMKKERQPVGEKSAGCVFKNPEGGPSAGQLLDQAGFKGKRHGGVAFSDLHANFLINSHHGTAREALELMKEARDAVEARTGIVLEPEVRIIPCQPL